MNKIPIIFTCHYLCSREVKCKIINVWNLEMIQSMEFFYFYVVFVSATKPIVKGILINNLKRIQKQLLKMVVPGTLGLSFLSDSS